jgi:hypothetical protein
MTIAIHVVITITILLVILLHGVLVFTRDIPTVGDGVCLLVHLLIITLLITIRFIIPIHTGTLIGIIPAIITIIHIRHTIHIITMEMSMYTGAVKML